MSKNGKPTPGIGQMIALEKIVPCPLNPRRTFDKDKLADLATSIAATGIQVPLIVRPVKRRAGHFELVDGERRYRAAMTIAELVEVPAIVRDLTDAQVLEAMLVVDVQRADIGDMERADGIFKLHTVHKMPLEEIARGIGRSVSTVRHLLRLRDLPKIVKQSCKPGGLPTSTAMAIARVPGTATRDKVARMVLMGTRHWNGETPTDADVAHRQKEDCEPLSYRETRSLIAAHCYRGLDGAPFSRQSLELIPAAGSCDDCPKRAGNLKDPEYANVREDMCLDVECFEAKIEANTAQVLAQCEESGTPVIAGDEARKLFCRWNPTQLDSHDWVDLSKECPYDREYRTYEKLLGKQLSDNTIPVTMAMDPAGTIHRLIPSAAAKTALKGIIDTGGGDSPRKREGAKQRAEDLIQKETVRRCMGLVAAKAEAIVRGIPRETIEGEKLCLLDMMRHIVDGVIDRTWDDVNRQVKIRRELAPKKKEKATSGGNRGLVAELVPRLDVPDLIALMAELVAGQKALGYGAMTSKSAENRSFWAFFDVDCAAELAAVRAQKKAGKSPESPTAVGSEAWRGMGCGVLDVSAKAQKYLAALDHTTVGELSDWLDDTEAVSTPPVKIDKELRKAIEILRSEHKPGAMERAAKRQQEPDAEFDFAEKELAHA